MLFVHVFGQTMFTADYYRFINNNFIPGEHVFITKRSKKNGMPPIPVVPTGAALVSPLRLIKYLYLLHKADGIMLHGIFSAKHLLLISRRKPWLKKTCWVIWGGDIYQHEKANKGLKASFDERVKQRYAPRLGFIAYLIDKDYALAKQWYGIQGKGRRVTYPVPLQRKGVFDQLQKSRKQREEGGPVRIVLGNSATVTNCHKEALDALSRFKEENIELYLPLNYGFDGFEAYAASVIEYAESLFGKEKVVPLTEKLEGEAYTELLGSMDVGIFYNNRQQAMGNIAILLAAGAKLYIRSDTGMWDHYREKGYVMEDALTIGTQSFEDFCRLDPEASEHNVQTIRGYLDVDLLVSRWSSLFDAMKAKAQFRSN